MTNRDRDDALATIEEVVASADERRWDRLPEIFEPEVVLDYGSPERVTPQQIVERWQPLLGAFDATNHVVGDAVVEPGADAGELRVRSAFRAAHLLRGAEGGDLWVLRGRYEHTLRRHDGAWRVSRMRMIAERSEGNDALVDRARAAGPSPARAYRVTPVSFESGGVVLRARLFVPAGTSATSPRPGVVVAGSWTTVQQQMPLAYARQLAARGFVALTFDFGGFGESDGGERDVEVPARKAEDLAAAATWLRTQDVVGSRGVAMVCVCASAGYAAQAVADGLAVDAVVMIAPWLHDAAIVEQIYGGADGVGERRVGARAARALFETTGEVRYVPAASSTEPHAAMYWPAEALDYYLSPVRGAIRQWGHRFAEMAWEDWLTFDALALAPRVGVPMVMIVSDEMAVPAGAATFASRLPTPPTVHRLSGDQFAFYDHLPTVVAAAEHASRELERLLA
jgi:dienelactone hydrolase